MGKFGLVAKTLTTLALVNISACAFAENNFYGVASAGYSQTELEAYELDSASYRLSVGYQYNEQWSFEVGFQTFGEENAGDLAISADEPVAEFPALFISALGKAEGRYGELFYRVGVAAINAEVSQFSSGVCASPFELSTVDTSSFCNYDGTIVAGHFGIGFDFFVHHSSMLRTEIEYTKGQDGFESAGLYIGFRYNF